MTTHVDRWAKAPIAVVPAKLRSHSQATRAAIRRCVDFLVVIKARPLTACPTHVKSAARPRPASQGNRWYKHKLPTSLCFRNTSGRTEYMTSEALTAAIGREWRGQREQVLMSFNDHSEGGPCTSSMTASADHPKTR